MKTSAAVCARYTGSMVSTLATRMKLVAAAEGSVRAEGLNPSARAKELVAEMVSDIKRADDVLRELVDQHTVKPQRS